MLYLNGTYSLVVGFTEKVFEIRETWTDIQISSSFSAGEIRILKFGCAIENISDPELKVLERFAIEKGPLYFKNYFGLRCNLKKRHHFLEYILNKNYQLTFNLSGTQ